MSPLRSNVVLQGQQTQAGFPWPSDSQAWWSALSCSVVAWFLVIGPHFNPQAFALVVAGVSLFLCSDWLSHLAGHSREGAVSPASWSEPVGLGLMGLTLLSLVSFLVELPSLGRENWGMVITGVACLVALMFVLRMEWRPLDGRLLYLTHLILTLPALVLGFVVWGVGSAQAFGVWLLPATYFPTQALLVQYWMEGDTAPRASLSVLATPLLLGILLLAQYQSWLATFVLASFLFRAITLLRARQRDGASLPGFAATHRLSQELQAWNLMVLLIWALSLR